MQPVRTTHDSATYRHGITAARSVAQYALERISKPILAEDKEALLDLIRQWPLMVATDVPAIEVHDAVAIPERFQNLPKRGRPRKDEK